MDKMNKGQLMRVDLTCIDLKYEIIRHPTNKYLFKARVWESHSLAIDLTPWVPEIDVDRSIEADKTARRTNETLTRG